RHQLQEIADVHVQIPNGPPRPLRIGRRLSTMAAHPQTARPPNGDKLRILQDHAAGTGVRMRAGAHGLRHAASAHGRTGCRAAGGVARVRCPRRTVRDRRTRARGQPADPGPGRHGRPARRRGTRTGAAFGGAGRPRDRAQPRSSRPRRTRAASRRGGRPAPAPWNGGGAMKISLRNAVCLSLLLALPLVHAAENPEAVALNGRLVAIEADPSTNALASLERLQARQAVQALATARSRARPAALEVAQWRVETAEV